MVYAQRVALDVLVEQTRETAVPLLQHVAQLEKQRRVQVNITSRAVSLQRISAELLWPTLPK